jgi:hypothetical protein
MRGAITFAPLVFNQMVPSMLAATLECHDCGAHKNLQYALTHGWRKVERELGSDVYITDYLCGDCCESRVIEYNQMINDQADDL